MSGYGIVSPERIVMLTRWVPPHETAIPEHGPDVSPCFFLLVPFPVVSAGAYGRVEATQVYTAAIHCSRS
jgi:hypothetical protein